MLSGTAMPQEIQQARKLGAAGFLSKDTECRHLCRIILGVSEGREWWPEASDDQRLHGPSLSARELQVLESARRGLSNGDIGRALSISEHTVKSHVKTLLKKLHAADRAEAVARGFEIGLLR
jgi:DNA-binding NarL/FixJ family response regulator